MPGPARGLPSRRGGQEVSRTGGERVDKVVASAAEAVLDVPDGASIAVGGFGLSGIPWVLIDALSTGA